MPPVPVVLRMEERTPVMPRDVEVAVVNSALVAVRLVEKKLVVVALVPVAKVKSKLTKCEVELAKIPD